MNATTTATTIEALAAREARVTTADLTDRNLYSMAMDYAQSYAGTFPFMVSMALQVSVHGQWLTENQAVAVLNCMVAEHRFQSKRAAVQQAEAIVSAPTTSTREYNHSAQVVTDGWYTIVGPKGGHRTLRLQTVEEKSDGVKQWLAYLSGSDNEGDYLTIGFVHGNEVKLFRKHEGKYADIVAAARFLIKNADKIGEYGKQYALRSGKCYRCGRKLTTPESIANGIGPVCSQK